jgi:hypothetical protein
MADNASNVHQAKPRSPSFSSVHVEIVNRRDAMNGFNQLWIGSRSSMPAIGDCAGFRPDEREPYGARYPASHQPAEIMLTEPSDSFNQQDKEECSQDELVSEPSGVLAQVAECKIETLTKTVRLSPAEFIQQFLVTKLDWLKLRLESSWHKKRRQFSFLTKSYPTCA